MENNWPWLLAGLGLIILILIAYIIYQRKEISFYKLQEEELDQYATEVETVYRQLRGIKHDYRNHLQGMSVFVETDQLDELENYIHQLNNELNKMDRIILIGNLMIDELLIRKLKMSQEHVVELIVTSIVR